MSGKCDELKKHHINEVMDMHNLTRGKMGFSIVYYADDVDAAIKELKDVIHELQAENAELKKKCEAEKSIGATFSKNGAELARWAEELRKEIESLKASHYAESVDAGMRERRLKRALYKACANWACAEYMGAGLINLKYPENWDEMKRKCLKKAEEYK